MKSISIVTICAIFSSIISGCEKNGGCDESHKNVKPVIVQKNHPASDIKEQNKTILRKAGFEFGKEKIVIDTKKTRDFLDSIGTKLEHAFGNMIRKGDHNQSLKEEVVKISDEKLEIDLKKTKEFMRNWADAIESFSKEIEGIMQESIE